MRTVNLAVLFVSAFWILVHEILQIVSLLALGLKTYFLDFTNYLDVAGVLLGFLFLADMMNEFGFIGGPRCKGNDDQCEIDNLNRFRWVASIVLLLFWYSFLSFLKSTFIDFAVFVGGLKNVVRGFFPFLMALVIILLAFANIFRLIYFDSEYCQCEENQKDEYCMMHYEDEDYSGFDRFCDSQSLLKVYVMLLGEVSDEEFFVRSIEQEGSLQILGIAFFIGFMFLVVILLANVLIAIVTDSYGVIKNERAAIVFWTNRLDYISECDAIINGPWKKRFLELFCVSDDTTVHKLDTDSETFGALLWTRLLHPPGDFSDLKLLSFEFWVYLFLRTLGWIAALCWLVIGYVTFGLLWPPQVREGIFFSNVNRGSGGEAKELEQRSIEVRSLREEVKDLHNDILHELTSDRKQVVAMKAQLNDMKDTLQNEMKTVKQVVTMLFDLQSIDA